MSVDYQIYKYLYIIIAKNKLYDLISRPNRILKNILVNNYICLWLK